MKKIYKIFSYLLFTFFFFNFTPRFRKKQIKNKDELIEKLETLNWYNLTNGKDHSVNISKQMLKFKFMIMSII